MPDLEPTDYEPIVYVERWACWRGAHGICPWHWRSLPRCSCSCHLTDANDHLPAEALRRPGIICAR